MRTMEQSFVARGLIVAGVALGVVILTLLMAGEATAADSPPPYDTEEDFVNRDGGDHTLIIDPGTADYLTREDLREHATYYRKRGFYANFMSWAQERSIDIEPDMRWAYCTQSAADRQDPTEPCPADDNGPDYVDTINIQDGAIRTGEITVLGDADGFIALACGNFWPVDGREIDPPTISGRKYKDVDADGQYEPGVDFKLEGWTIELIYEGKVLTSTQTDSKGKYSFELDANQHTGPEGQPITEGTYEVREVQQQGWRASETPEPIEVRRGAGDYTGRDFGNYQPVEISGRKFEDMAADGPDAGDPGRSGWAITATGPDTVSTTTGSDGSYSLDGLTPGTYEVSEQLHSGWEQSHPTSGTYTVTLDSGEKAAGLDFGNYQPAVITGRKFHDLDVNGQDDTEPGVAEWPISISGDESATAQTTADGAYRIDELTPGQYTIAEGSRAGWRQTSPLSSGEHTVTARSGDVLNGNDFGNVCLADLDVTVTDATTGQALDDVEVRLEEVDVTGVLDNDPALPRTSDGEFTGLLPGDYRVEVFVPQGYGTTDADVELVDGRFAIVKQVSLAACDDASLATDVVSGSNGKVTGGKWIDVITGDDPSQRANAGFVFMVRHGQPEGNLQYQDRSAGLNLHTKTIDVLVVSGNEAWVWGRWHDGSQQQRFRLHLIDNGEPGGDDVFELSVTPDYTAGFGHTIDGGNIQVHQGGGPPQ